jgi:hypothetical protein
MRSYSSLPIILGSLCIAASAPALRHGPRPLGATQGRRAALTHVSGLFAAAISYPTLAADAAEGASEVTKTKSRKCVCRGVRTRTEPS